MRNTTFTLTEDHLKLLRQARVDWDDCETGAPAIDPKRPYGNSDVPRDVAEILGWDSPNCPHCGESLDETYRDRALALHRETAVALQIVLETGRFEPGDYAADEFGRGWARA